MNVVVKDEQQMANLGKLLAARLRGGDVVELIGDVGAGKTTLTRAIARARGISGPIQSPTFTISNQYRMSDGTRLVHYDFYRLNEAGLMADELSESMDDNQAVTIIEWGNIVADILPGDRLTVKITSIDEDSRQVEIIPNGKLAERFGELQ